MYYKILVLAFFIFSCQESDNSLSNNRPHNQMSTTEPHYGRNKIKENEFEKDTDTINSQNKKETFPKAKKYHSFKYRPNSIIANKPTKETVNKNREINNEYQQKKEKWYAFYSDDSTWLDLYNTSEASFIKGCEKEFIKNPNLINTINKPFLVNIFLRKMEELFFNSPSFIQFSTDRLRTSEAFTRLQTKWNIPE